MINHRLLKGLLYPLFSITVAAGVFSYIFMHITPADVVDLIRNVDRGGLAAFVALSISMSFFRTWRYYLLLRVSGYHPGVFPLFLVVLVRNLFSDLLPARTGSLIYVYIITSRLGVPLGASTSSFAVAFLFDLFAMLPLILAALLVFGGNITGINSITLISIILAAGSALLALIWFLPALCSGLERVATKSFSGFSPRVRSIEKFFESTRAELQTTKESGIYMQVFILSLMVRAAKYGSLYLFLYALLKPLGYSFVSLPPDRVFLGFSAAELAASLPVSGIAGFGAYEGAWTAAFSVLGFSSNMAKLTAISHHLFTQVYGYSIGGFALIILLMPLFKKVPLKPAPLTSSPQSAVFFLKALAAAGTAVFLSTAALISLSSPAVGAQTEPDHPSAGENRAVSGLGAGGLKIVFDSNRSGSFGIYTMNLSDQTISTVADDKTEEMYPDPSPDGGFVVYAKALSTLRTSPSDIWIAAINGEDRRMLVKNGTFPTFSGDGKRVYFERNRKRVMAVNSDGTGIREIFPNSYHGFKRYQIVKPRLSKDGRYLAFISDRKGAWNTWYVDLKTGDVRHVGKGCEPGWYNAEKKLFWITSEGTKGGSGIYSLSVESGEKTVIHDLGSPRGHEYFPSLSRDDSLLLYSSCRDGEHSHISANYQIFIKSFKTGETTRITFDSYTNRWPKVIPVQKP